MRLGNGPHYSRVKSFSPSTRIKVVCLLVFCTFWIEVVECATAGTGQVPFSQRGSSTGLPSRKICRIKAAGSDVESPQHRADALAVYPHMTSGTPFPSNI